MSKKILYFLFCCVCITQFIACDSEPDLPDVIPSGGNVKMIVVNEGLFTTNTAALSVIYNDGNVDWNIFQTVNKRPLGDVAQSLTYINDYYFLAINNSKKIEIIDPETFKSVGTILYEEAGSPRFIASINDSIAVVSDLYGQLVKIRTKPPYRTVEFLKLPSKNIGIEKMTVAGNKLFGAYFSKGIAVFDCNNVTIEAMRLIPDVKVGENTKTAKMIADANGKLWVMTSDNNQLTWNCINPATEKVEKKVEIPYVKSNWKKGDIVGMPNYNRVDVDASNTKIYFNLMEASRDNNGQFKTQVVYTFDVNTLRYEPYMELPDVKMMYGMGISPNGEVCICDCLDYSAQRGYVRVHAPGNETVVSYKVGVYPRMVYFPENNK
ncbi:DUF5074 domain-containing protein [Limibacterium fermenti]|uniref:DUF5074 domain-containing protein n=1 Tax=Limibacterium fermenti TaxID=3229863 RepID=UPI000E9E9F1C|nr:hypothetical protein [Porphyromonadaceae bacterium]